MGTCYSKSGHDIDPALVENRPREKGSKNGHLKSKKKTPLLTVDSIPIHKDVSDTVFTEDSHVGNALDIENCINKSQQTSLDHLAKVPSKTIDNAEASSTTCGDWDQDKDKDTPAECGLVVEKCGVSEGQVVASDSGIVVESCASLGCEYIGTVQSASDTKDAYSESFEHIVDDCKQDYNKQTVSSPYKSVSQKTFQEKEKVQSQIISSLKQSSEIICQNGHSSKAYCNGENRRSISSLDRLSESHKNMDSTTDLDKIKLVLRQSSVSSSEQRFYADQVDTSYELPSLMQQPEIMTTTLNGREVVVIDADLFTQITDEIQFLKMKLMELKEDIQDTDIMDTTGRTGRSTPLSSVSSIS